MSQGDDLKVFLVLLTFLNLNSVWALEIDEKLTLRFLKVSNTKKTVLINRGAEDGLVAGDHAKFFITSGVIARGVIEKVSPSRSIWSLYRVVDPAEIIDGKVLNLKISSPVKITDDPSKSMKDEPIPVGSDQMEMSDGASEEGDKTSTNNDDEQKELEGMGLEEEAIPAKKPASKKSKKDQEINIPEETPVVGGSNTSRNWEVWGTLYVNSLSGTVSNSDTTTTGSTAVAASTMDLSVGLERYFLSSENFLKNMSITAFLHKRVMESGQDKKNATDWFEFGGGLNYHFYNSPAATNRMIGFGALNAGAGTSNRTDTEITNGVSTETAVKGTNIFVSGAIGSKYVLSNGFGMRVLLDYYSSSETYSYPSDIVVKRTLAGPRIQFGISYRF